MATKSIELGTITGIQYSKDGDSKTFLRFRINGKTVIDGKICQVNGFVTQVKGQE